MKITNDTLLKVITLKGAVNCADFEHTKFKQPIARIHNTDLAKLAVQCSADSFVLNQTDVLRINIFVENRHLRQARKPYGSFCKNRH